MRIFNERGHDWSIMSYTPSLYPRKEHCCSGCGRSISGSNGCPVAGSGSPQRLVSQSVGWMQEVQSGDCIMKARQWAGSNLLKEEPCGSPFLKHKFTKGHTHMHIYNHSHTQQIHRKSHVHSHTIVHNTRYTAELQCHYVPLYENL